MEFREHRWKLLLLKFFHSHLTEDGKNEPHRLVLSKGIIGPLLPFSPKVVNDDLLDQFIFFLLLLLVSALLNIAVVHNLF